MRIGFIGCVEFSLRAAESLASLPEAEICCVVTRESSPGNADFASLAPLGNALGVPTLFAEQSDEAGMLGFLSEAKPEVLYCFGWSRLLSSQVLAVAPKGVIGFHPAPLPRGRGRHPIIWALVLGLASTASTFFYMDEGADSGDLLSQITVPITPEDDARSLYDRIVGIAMAQIASFTPQLAAGDAPRQKQAVAEATYWRKRSAADGRIDWRMPAASIVDLVRALRPPYPGATCLYNDRLVPVWRARVGQAAPRDVEPGRVLGVRDGAITVKCDGESSVDLVEHELRPVPKEGECL